MSSEVEVGRDGGGGVVVVVVVVDADVDVEGGVEALSVVVLAAAVEDDEDEEAAARIRSPYWMLHRTTLLAAKLVAQLVRRGQHALVVPLARLVQGTEFASSQAEGWST